jgi:hypothetical protein
MRVDDLSMAAHAGARADRYLRETAGRDGLAAGTRPWVRAAIANTLVRIAVRMAPAGQLTVPPVMAPSPRTAR